MYWLFRTKQEIGITTYPYMALVVMFKDGSEATFYFIGTSVRDPRKIHPKFKKEAFRFLDDFYTKQWIMAAIIHVWGAKPDESFAVEALTNSQL